MSEESILRICIAYGWTRKDVLDLTTEQFNTAVQVAREFHGGK